jgi:hypothetical protein
MGPKEDDRQLLVYLEELNRVSCVHIIDLHVCLCFLIKLIETLWPIKVEIMLNQWPNPAHA